ncbi:hypothetical protein MRX96_013677 [Rhipicephalus microplus]
MLSVVWQAREAEIKIISGVILLLSRPESTSPGIASASLRKELRVVLQRRWDGLKAVARAERWEMEAWCSRTILRRHLARTHMPLTSLIDLENTLVTETFAFGGVRVPRGRSDHIAGPYAKLSSRCECPSTLVHRKAASSTTATNAEKASVTHSGEPRRNKPPVRVGLLQAIGALKGDAI